MIPSESAAASKAPPLSLHHRIILSVMMFLQFAIWGSWVIVYYPFLTNRGFTPAQATSITGNMFVGAIISTLFAGYLADRWINSERLMGICHLVGAGLLYAMTLLTTPDQYFALFIVTFIYSLVFNPTLSVINSLTFRNVPDGERDFPGLRVLGTIGWIC
nr:MFS transporter [Pirellula sp.]